jgi:hypothetical protein
MIDQIDDEKTAAMLRQLKKRVTANAVTPLT